MATARRRASRSSWAETEAGVKTSWHWPSTVAVFYWALYRKQWLYAVAFALTGMFGLLACGFHAAALANASEEQVTTFTRFWLGVAVAAFLVPPRTAYLPQVPRLFSEPLADTVLLGHERRGQQGLHAVQVRQRLPQEGGELARRQRQQFGDHGQFTGLLRGGLRQRTHLRHIAQGQQQTLHHALPVGHGFPVQLQDLGGRRTRRLPAHLGRQQVGVIRRFHLAGDLRLGLLRRVNDVGFALDERPFERFLRAVDVEAFTVLASRVVEEPPDVGADVAVGDLDVARLHGERVA